MVLYWDIGQSIVEKQNECGWGKSIVEILSKDFQNEFPGIQGYSVQNLWYMRNFYDQYKENTKLQPLVGEISRSHNMVIMEKYKDNLEREFYIQMTRKYGWKKNVLIHQIERKSHEKFYSIKPTLIKSFLRISIKIHLVESVAKICYAPPVCRVHLRI